MNLAYDDRGDGEPVLFIAGQGGLGRTWDLFQVPAFRAAGYRVITFDNRGVGATSDAEGFTSATMVADTVELIERLDISPVRVVAVSMGSYIAQELMLSRPELVSQAALMATRARHDRAREFFGIAERDLAEAGVRLPATYDAKLRLLENFSPRTLNDEDTVRDWIDMFTRWPAKVTPGIRAQYGVAPQSDRRPSYRAITTDVLVIGFADDLVMPPHLGAEVADALPHGRYLEIPDTGHLGFLERPEVVNSAILDFFSNGGGRADQVRNGSDVQRTHSWPSAI
ncbi:MULTISPECIES: alpha/beta fold hydrolase [Mycobacterium]|uniref:alpha/beta fold hydrolase n=1 Tax=Mycobacterium TaxID=1763 RepID=UPI0009F2A0B2|nr:MULTISPECIES: alpha/beta hydrolase [Mycobacterium]MCG7608139.1 alpha/beta hydrolase [Mycobacterium sp. CnD-18-1]TMS53821.1 alpha/beta hydrolase [Mycobacterium sp. DBP42]